MPDLPLRRLIPLIGEEAVKILIKECPGYRFNIPKKPGALEFTSQEEKKQRIRDMIFIEGKTPVEIADALEITVKRVHELINDK